MQTAWKPALPGLPGCRQAGEEQADDCTLFGRRPTDHSGLAIATVPV
jgi:hypothetical protein